MAVVVNPITWLAESLVVLMIPKDSSIAIYCYKETLYKSKMTVISFAKQCVAIPAHTHLLYITFHNKTIMDTRA